MKTRKLKPFDIVFFLRVFVGPVVQFFKSQYFAVYRYYKKKDFICVYAQFKNEKHALKEWVEHYVDEGVDHIFLVDNGSTDNYDVDFLEGHPKVTLLFEDRKHAQAIIVKEVYKKYIEKSFHWVFVCDLDEFLYAKNEKKLSTVIEKITQKNNRVKCIAVPWKMFGSNGHVMQPESIIKGFTKRNFSTKQMKNYHSDSPNPSTICIKCLFRTSYGYIPWIHHPLHNNRKMISFPCAVNVVDSHDESFVIDSILKANYPEEKFDSAELQLNHYPIQSLEFFEKVKMTRGSAATTKNDNVRNRNYFINYDTNFLVDEELLKKKY